MIDEIMRTYEDAEITKDPFISPALSPDDLLRGLPPINLIVSNWIISEIKKELRHFILSVVHNLLESTIDSLKLAPLKANGLQKQKL